MRKALDGIKVLVVGTPESIHAARFTMMLKGAGPHVKFFASEVGYTVDEHLRGVDLHVAVPLGAPGGCNVAGRYALVNLASRPFRDIREFRYFVSGPLAKRISRVRHLIRLIRQWRPDIVISLKLQNEGYITAQARQAMGRDFKAKWIHFCWGTDIEFFGKHPDYRGEHGPKIRQALSLCDYLVADTQRDIRQAPEFGVKGTALGKCIAQGGFDLGEIEAIRKDAAGLRRDVIIVKGREGGLVGKAYNALAALYNCREALAGYRIVVMYGSENVKHVAEFLERSSGMRIEVLSRVPYTELLKIYAQSRMAISASDVDGTPGFLLEAMALGALPVHSNMDSIRELITDGENGLLFPVDDIAALGACIRRGLSDDALVASADGINWELIRRQADEKIIAAYWEEVLEKVMGGG